MAQTYGGGGGVPYIPGLPVYNKSYAAPATPGPPKYNKSYAAKPKKAVAPKRPVAPRRPAAPRSAITPAYSTPVRSGKSVGSNSSGRIAKTAPAPPPKATASSKPQTADQWIASGGDSVYKAQKNALAQALKDYQTRNNKDITDYGITNTANRKSLMTEKDRSGADLLNDYAARGALGGVQNQAQTMFNTDWSKKTTDFDTAFTNWTNDANTALADYKTSNKNQLTKAQQDAIARRAAAMGG